MFYVGKKTKVGSWNTYVSPNTILNPKEDLTDEIERMFRERNKVENPNYERPLPGREADIAIGPDGKRILIRKR